MPQLKVVTFDFLDEDASCSSAGSAIRLGATNLVEQYKADLSLQVHLSQLYRSSPEHVDLACDFSCRETGAFPDVLWDSALSAWIFSQW